MDWADDVAYSVHDVEDGVHAGLIRLAHIQDDSREALCAVASDAVFAAFARRASAGARRTARSAHAA